MPDSVTAEVRDGWVTLRGQADRRYESQEIERAVRSVHCVKDVSNEINVRFRPLIPRAYGHSEPGPPP